MKKGILAIFLVVALFLAACTAPQTAPEKTTTDNVADATAKAPTKVAAETKNSDGTILTKVGVMFPLTGDAASYGLAMKKALELAQEELGGDIELIYEDSKCDGKEAVTAINKLISVDEVEVIIGEVCSGATLAAAPIAEENEVVMVSPSSTSPKITDNRYVFRTVPSDALQGAFGADLVKEDEHETLAVLYSNEDYGMGFKDVLVKSFEEKGGEVVATEAIERKSVDARTQLTKIKSKKPDALYLVSNSPDSAIAILKQIKELGVNAALYASEGLKSQDILKGAGDAAEGMVLSTVSGGSANFIESHENEFEEEPGPFAAQAYDAYRAVLLAYQGRYTDGTGDEPMQEALADVEFTGASGKVAFDDNGDVSGNYDVFEVKEGSFVQKTE